MSVSTTNASVPFGKTNIEISSGKLAKQANGSVTVTQGETVILVTACVAPEAREGIDFFPMTVDYEERMYAAGKISSSKFMKREGRPSEDAILNGRIIDRSIRPMFPKGFRREVQIIVTVLSYDETHHPAALAVVGASAALLQTDAPFEGPIAALTVGRVNGQLILNPTEQEMEQSDLDMIVAGTANKISMIEVAANEIPEKEIQEAFAFAQKGIAEAIEPQKVFISTNKEKIEFVEPEYITKVREKSWSELREIVKETDYAQRNAKVKQLTEKLCEEMAEELEASQIKEAIDATFLKAVRSLILEDKQRPDGRAMDEVRPVSAEVGLLPRVHGSGLFNRGETQALTVVTLAGPSQEQWIDTMEEFGKKRYIHHYNFPPYSTGEVKKIGGGNRREIGHGALAEKALVPVIPSKEEFPYTIRLVSETLGSNGSSSMAATCGSTLALMDAGVPIKLPVAGIAMGLVSESDDSFQVLTDLQGLEDFAGEMDFKIAGTKNGITAIQLDVKNKGLTEKMIAETFEAALIGRNKIMEEMLKTIDKPRAELSKYAPKIITTKIDPDKIGELIGPGGKNINKIIDDNGGHDVLGIDIEEDGTVMITTAESSIAQRVKDTIESIGKPIEVNQEFQGTVTQIVKDRNSGKDIGAIVQLTPNRDGMIHISSLGNGQFVRNVSDVVNVGDPIKVRVKEVDAERGRISLVRID